MIFHFKPEITYSSLLNLYPRGNDQIAVKSRVVCDAIKLGKTQAIESSIKYIQENSELYSDFLGENITLVPVPRSSLVATGAVFPSLLIAETYVQNKLGSNVSICLERATPIRRASRFSNAEDRPLVNEQIESMKVSPQLIDTDCITIIDDIITQGRTTVACYQILKDAYPDKQIRIFALMQTVFGEEVAEFQLINPKFGTIDYYSSSGKTFRQ